MALAVAAPAGGSAVPPVQVETVTSPAAPGAFGAAMFTAPDGGVWLSWVEPAPGGGHALRCATWAPGQKTWQAPRTVTTDRTLTMSQADFPQLAANAAGQAVVIWTDGHGGACVSRSADRGATWSAPAPFATDRAEVEKFSLTVLADGRFLAAWLDGRGKKAGGKMEQLFARVLGEGGAETLVDASVCDCCQTALTPFLDGGALLAYRARTEDEVRDIRIVRLHGATWEKSRPLNNDDWHLAGCPINGPRLASDGGRVAAAWFTAADNDPRVLVSYSPDAGERFLQPLRVDRGHPTGHVDTLLLRDNTLLVAWLEADGSAWLRRISPDYTADEPVALAPAGTIVAKDFPRLALLRDYAGGTASAQIAAALVTEGKNPGLQTVLVTLPEGDLLVAGKNCDCAPTPEQLAGFPVRGTIAALEAGALRVRHFEVPGVLESGTHTFRAPAQLLANVQPGRQFLGRIERRDGAWWLFDVRLVATNAAVPGKE
jgi:hypothetical protein